MQAVSAMGHVDALTTSGFLEGWAHAPEQPGQPLEVVVQFSGEEVGRGIANGFRWDLADIACGIGWCAFRLRIDGLITTISRGPLILIDGVQGTEICTAAKIPVLEDGEPHLSTIGAVIEADPTVIRSVDQLRGCGVVFDRYLKQFGIEGFVRAAYVYILGRPADAPGLANYSALLKSGSLTPYGLLDVLRDSDEFCATPRTLGAPTEPGFIFAVP